MAWEDLLEFRSAQEISLLYRNRARKGMEPVRRANECRNRMTSSDRLANEFPSGAAGGAQHNEFHRACSEKLKNASNATIEQVVVLIFTVVLLNTEDRSRAPLVTSGR
jgi:hypothetical protein